MSSTSTNRIPRGSRLPRVPILPDTLMWALEWNGLTYEELAKSIKVKPEKAQEWLEGKTLPTHEQAKRIAKRLMLSISDLLLPPPDKVNIALLDMRAGPHFQSTPSPELLEVYYDALRKQDWLRSRRSSTVLDFVGKFSIENNSVREVATYLSKHLSPEVLRSRSRTWEDFFRALTRKLEDMGIIVMRSKRVTPNGRELNVEEFKGFAIADPVAPIIFVNTNGFIASNTFTLAHELAHLAIGESVLDSDPLTSISNAQKERFCNSVAAELLAPEEEFRHLWTSLVSEDQYSTVQETARHFKISAFATAVRARELNLISFHQFTELQDQLSKATKPRKKSGRGNPDRTLEARNGYNFTQSVARALKSGEITYTDASSLLNTSIKSLLGYLDRSNVERRNESAGKMLSDQSEGE